MTSPLLLSTLLAHVPSALYRLILEYAGDALEVFMRARDAVLRWSEDWDDEGEKNWCELDLDQTVCWTLYRAKFRPFCGGNYMCMLLVHQTVKHGQPIGCWCTDLLLKQCTPWCDVCCSTSHSIQP